MASHISLRPEPAKEHALRIATWNVNSVRQRLGHLLGYLKETSPDALCLQELKCQDEAFPRAEVEELGYNVATHGQKGFNGVAILAKRPFEVTPRPARRFLRRAIALYRGGPADRQRRGPARLHLSAQRQSGARRQICLQARLHEPADRPFPAIAERSRSRWCWRAISTSSPSRATPPTPPNGLSDALFLPRDSRKVSRTAGARLHRRAARRPPTPAGLYTFWDYQAGAWQRNNGIRIDHLLLSPQAADLLRDAGVDKQMRALEKASDHIPAWIDLQVE